jgi:hypothetical protein
MGDAAPAYGSMKNLNLNYGGAVRRRFFLVAFSGAALASALRLAHASGMAPDKSSPVPLPRDPQIAVQEEFDRAAGRNTAADWDLFIARHPNNRLTPEARRRRAALR